MVNALSVIVSNLDQGKRDEITLQICRDLDAHEENVDSLCEMLEFVSVKVKEEIYPQLLRYCEYVITRPQNHSTSSCNNLVRLMQMFPQLYVAVTSKVAHIVGSYVGLVLKRLPVKLRGLYCEMRVDKEGNGRASYDDGQESYTDEYILSLLSFLERIFTQRKDGFSSAEEYDIIALACLLCGADNEVIVERALSVLRWKMELLAEKTKESTFVWDVLYPLVKSNTSFHVSVAYKLWLRYMTNSKSELVLNGDLYQKKVIRDDKFWNVLQNGLITESHEQRKLCISLLKVCVRSINTSFKNSIMEWKNDQADRYSEEWIRYLTLFEILGIDTSLHQAEAGVQDIVNMVSPTSLIHPSWGYSLISAGFKASMESVRKFALSILLSIPSENLPSMKYALNFFETTYLPFAMQAYHFNVRQHFGTNEHYCEYAQQLSEFICTLIKCSSDSEVKEITLSIFKVLNNYKDAFDPSKFYVSLGLFKGLRNRRILEYDVHGALLSELFETRCEGSLLQISYQSTLLQVLFHFGTIDLNEFLMMLSRYIKFNGCKIILRNQDALKEYLNVNAIDSQTILKYVSDDSLSEDQKVLALYLGVNMLELSSKLNVSDLTVNHSDSFVIKYLSLGIGSEHTFDHNLASRLSNILLKANSSGITSEDLSRLSEIEYPCFEGNLVSESQLKDLWGTVVSSSDSEDQTDLGNQVWRYKLLNNLLATSSYKVLAVITWENILLLHVNAFQKSKQISRLTKDFYKVKECFYGEIYQTMYLLVSEGIPTNNDIEKGLSFIDINFTNYDVNIIIVCLLDSIIKKAQADNLIVSAAKLLTQLWDNLQSSRLQLNHKDLHVKIVDTVFQPKVLSCSTSEPELGDTMLACGVSVIKWSEGRRCLLPSLTRCLSNYQVLDNVNFERLGWIPELLVQGFTVYQLRNNVFRLENIVACAFDLEVLPSSDSHLYEEIYGPREISSKVNLLAILNSIKTSEFGVKILQYIFDHESDFSLFKVLKSTDGFEEWRRIQIFALLVSIIDTIDSNIVVEKYLPTFTKLLETEPSPLVRVYIEWIVSMKLIDDEELSSSVFSKLKSLIDRTGMKPALVASFERVLFLLIQKSPSEKKSTLLLRFLSIIIPGATSNKAMTRHFSVSLLSSIYPELSKQDLKLEPGLLAIMENIYTCAVNSDLFGQYRSGDALMWDIIDDLNLVSISGEVLLRLSDREVDFLTREDFMDYLTKQQIEWLNHPIGHNLKKLWIKERSGKEKVGLIKSLSNMENGKVSQSPLQTKSGSWNALTYNDDTPHNHSVERSDLIVISSLVDKPPNLGGICRLCDVLGAGLLTLNDAKVKNHPQFQSVAVTADQWMPIMELKVEHIKNFLQAKKKDGYTLIGLEQTDKSVELNHGLEFPKKSIILLGREKEGVPGDLLAELDICVEIKQVGVIRSMNIQTATAIIVHAYSSQHC